MAFSLGVNYIDHAVALVGEVSANFLRVEVFKWSAQRIPMAINLGFLHRKYSSRHKNKILLSILSFLNYVNSTPLLCYGEL
jgi:hypothetical protein